MSRWRHLICDECYGTESEQDDRLPAQPIRVAVAFREGDDCCFCGLRTTSGIWIRKDPEGVKCGGVHHAHQA